MSEALNMSKPVVVNVAEFINRAPMSGFQVLVVALCSLVVLLDGFDTQSISFAAPLLAPSLGVKVAAFGPIFGAGQIGQMIGVLLVGPFADRMGRKSMVISAVVVFGVFSLMTVWVTTFTQLMVLRLVTGLGLGAAMPNVFSIISEYAPARLKGTLVAGSAAAFPLGAVIGGALSAKLVPVYGWQVIFLGAGILPLVLALLLLVQLPESIRFLVYRGGAERRVAKFLALIDSTYRPAGDEKFVIGEVSPTGMPVLELFRNGRRRDDAVAVGSLFHGSVDVVLHVQLVAVADGQGGVADFRGDFRHRSFQPRRRGRLSPPGQIDRPIRRIPCARIRISDRGGMYRRGRSFAGTVYDAVAGDRSRRDLRHRRTGER